MRQLTSRVVSGPPGVLGGSPRLSVGRAARLPELKSGEVGPRPGLGSSEGRTRGGKLRNLGSREPRLKVPESRYLAGYVWRAASPAATALTYFNIMFGRTLWLTYNIQLSIYLSCSVEVVFQMIS